MRAGRIGDLARRPTDDAWRDWRLNLAVPLVFLALMATALRAWHNPDEAAIVLVGLALVSSMPIAGSSTGWAQTADGDMALSLGLVLGSTLLSPLSGAGLTERAVDDSARSLRGNAAPDCRARHGHLLGRVGTTAIRAGYRGPINPRRDRGFHTSSEGSRWSALFRCSSFATRMPHHACPR